MIYKNKHDIYESSQLTALGIFHGFSNRYDGDVLTPSGLSAVLDRMHMTVGRTICCEQVHAGAVSIVHSADMGKEISACDGLVLADDGIHPIALRLRVADCVPIIAVDPRQHIIGVAHAGWAGTIAGICETLVQKMTSIGAHVDDIYAAIGPHIGMCCYTITEDRADLFQKQFGRNEKIGTKIDGVWHVDIGYANYCALQKVGVTAGHIDWSIGCTSCQVSEFFSYRKDTKETFGEQIGLIGFL